jgi:hypothetical protein
MMNKKPSGKELFKGVEIGDRDFLATVAGFKSGEREIPSASSFNVQDLAANYGGEYHSVSRPVSDSEQLV